MRINNNMSAVVTNNQLLGTEDSLAKSMERLSSGLRINHASDDPSGIAIAGKMNAQIEGLTQASRNGDDGKSVFETADGALKEVTDMLQRMRELAVQAANGTNADSEKESIQAEIESLKDEIDRISITTEFNTKKLLDGSSDAHVYADHVSRVQTSNYVAAGIYEFTVEKAATRASVGITAAVITDNTWTTMNTVVGSFLQYDKDGNPGDRIYKEYKDTEMSLSVPSDPTKGLVDFVNESTWSYTAYESDGTVATSASGTGLAVSGTVSINGREVILTQGMSGEAVYEALRDAAEYAEAKIDNKDEPLRISSKKVGADSALEVAFSSEDIAKALGGFSRKEYKDVVGSDAVIDIVDVTETSSLGVEDSQFGVQTTAAQDGNHITFTNTDGFKISLMLDEGYAKFDKDGNQNTDKDGNAISGVVRLNVTEIGIMKLQIGANEGQTMAVRLKNTDCKSMYIDDLDVTTVYGADNALESLDDALSYINNFRSQLGAYENRLDHTTASLDETAENMTQAMSRIEDVDMATEMVEYTKYNVLEQAGTSALAQANELPQLALQLLQ